MQSKLFILALLALLLYGCTNNIEHGSLEILVSNSESYDPIESATLKIYYQDIMINQTTTDSNGNAFFTLPPGDYSIEVSALNYQNQETTATIEVEKNVFLEIALVAEEQCEETWICTNWTECLNSTQSRTCIDNNSCGTEESKPSETQECNETEEPECITAGDCPDNDSCKIVECVDETCQTTAITYCANDDDCCPSNCIYSNDNDCPSTQNCAVHEDCDDDDDCTHDKCTINGECNNAQIFSCTDDDGCCPTDCAYASDNDCEECDEDWDCDAWENCTDGTQERECTDDNDCGSTVDRPDLTRDCCEDDTDCDSNEKCVDDQCELKNCTEQGGFICLDNETCAQDYIEASDTDYCCPEECTPETPLGDLYLLEDSIVVSGVGGKGTMPICSFDGQENRIWFDINSTFPEPIDVFMVMHLNLSEYSAYGTIEFDIDTTLQPGPNTFEEFIPGVSERTVNIRLDVENSVEEANETNNIASKYFDFELIDLYFEDVSYNEVDHVISMDIKRTAITTDCSHFFVGVMVNGTDGFINHSGMGFVGLDPTLLTIEIPYPSPPQSLHMELDSYNFVNEFSEINNVFTCDPCTW